MTNKVIAQVVKAGKQYTTGDTVITALQPSTIDLKSGELTLIIGPSGSGKTTLLSLFGCIIYPTSGDIFIDGIKINDLSENKLAAIRLKKNRICISTIQSGGTIKLTRECDAAHVTTGHY